MPIPLSGFAFGVVLQLLLRAMRPSIKILPLPALDWRRLHNLRLGLRPYAVALLLIQIGVSGGSEIATSGIANLWRSGLLSIALAVLMFGCAILVLHQLRIGQREDQISLATHVGSVSVGTFAAAQSLLTQSGIVFDHAAAVWLVLMELPALLLGLLALRGTAGKLHELLRQREILILLGALLLGSLGVTHSAIALLGDLGMSAATIDHTVDLLFHALLTIFMIDMGLYAGSHLDQLFQTGYLLVFFGISMALLGSLLGALAATLIGLNTGNSVLLATLCGSASYVAAPALLEGRIAHTSIALSLAVSLGVTLTWNLLFGLHITIWVVSQLQHASQVHF